MRQKRQLFQRLKSALDSSLCEDQEDEATTKMDKEAAAVSASGGRRGEGKGAQKRMESQFDFDIGRWHHKLHNQKLKTLQPPNGPAFGSELFSVRTNRFFCSCLSLLGPEINGQGMDLCNRPCCVHAISSDRAESKAKRVRILVRIIEVL